MKQEDLLIILTTFGDRKDAERISKELLRKKLCACIQLIKISCSLYWWRNKIESSEEWLCIIKTRLGLYKKLEEELSNCHPYKTPEIVSIKAEEVSSEYLEWLYSVVR
ncbi:hypothetical protein B6U74_02340 [Candidatus Bathyarchaeota archaeon ex4484_205]|nr:MAG: hypothetical protein B6U74_02340 [Candidatus Bathyarchaeota archaeon ex4484_205]